MEQDLLPPVKDDDKLGPHKPHETGSAKSSQQKLKNLKKITIAVAAIAFVLLILTVVFVTRANINSKTIQEAVDKGEKIGADAQKKTDEANFQKEKNGDTRVYTSPDEYGAFQLTLPKYYSLMVTPGANGAFSAFSHPDVVDAKAAQQALRIEIKPALFDNTRKTYDGLARDKGNNIRTEKVTVSGIEGLKYTGKIDQKTDVEGTAILLPVRDKTYIIQTDDNSKYLAVFNQIISQIKITP